MKTVLSSKNLKIDESTVYSPMKTGRVLLTMNEIFNNAMMLWNGQDGVNQYLRFIHSFNLSKTEHLKLFITADTNYAVWLNGHFAGAGQYADYPDYKVYDEMDVSDYAKTGENRLCILGYSANEDSSVTRKGQPGVLFVLTHNDKALVRSGADTLCSPAQDYTSGPVEKLSGQLSFSFEYDATKRSGWTAADYAIGGGWTVPLMSLPPELYPRPAKRLTVGQRLPCKVCAQGVFLPNKKVTSRAEGVQTAFLSPANLIPAHASLPCESGYRLSADVGEGLYIVVDLGREEAGWLDVELSAQYGTKVDIAYGEHLDDLRVRAFVGGRCFAAGYTCTEGRQHFTHYFKRAGCRYIQLHIHGDEAVLYYIGLLPVEYPVSRRGWFECTDRLHQRIAEVGQRTLTLCMHEHYEDTPWREQALYAMDSRNQMLCGYYCFGEYEFAKASIRLLALGIRPDGLLELCAPARVRVVIPYFSLMWIIQLWEYLLYSGDTEFAAEMIGTAEKIIETFSYRMEKNGLVSKFAGKEYWNFYEWSEGMSGYSQWDKADENRWDLPLNAFFSMALDAMQKLCQNLSKPVGYYGKLKIKVNKAISSHFWDSAALAFASYENAEGKQHYGELTQALAVLCGAADEEQSSAVLALLAEPNNGLVPVTLSHSIFKYEALLTKPERYTQTVFDSIAQTWGDMLFKGATSFWETSKGGWDFDRAGSLCHGWSAIPVYFYYAYILGVKPLLPGFESFSFSPLVPAFTANGRGPFPGGGYLVNRTASFSPPHIEKDPIGPPILK